MKDLGFCSAWGYGKYKTTLPLVAAIIVLLLCLLLCIIISMWYLNCPHLIRRFQSDSNFRPACFNASAAGPVGPGTYAACRVEMMVAFTEIVKRGQARSIAVSNWQIRDLQVFEPNTSWENPSLPSPWFVYPLLITGGVWRHWDVPRCARAWGTSILAWRCSDQFLHQE